MLDAVANDETWPKRRLNEMFVEPSTCDLGKLRIKLDPD
jgi:hypothetical protein